MDEALYPKDRYPQGHPDLATSLNNLGTLLQAQGAYGEARGYYERALAMQQALYPKDRYPHGHPELATSLNNLGALLQAQGSYGEARGYYERALAMHEALYPKDRYPQGHPELATSLNNLGSLLQAQGSYGEARGYYERALAMQRGPLPQGPLPPGAPRPGQQPEQPGRHCSGPRVLRRGGDLSPPGGGHAARTGRGPPGRHLRGRSDDYLAQLPLSRDALVSVSLHLPDSDDPTYRRIWDGKSAVARILRDRQAAALGQARTNPATQRTIAAWRDAAAGSPD